MSDAINYLRTSVDLNSYSKSAGFVGYFNSEGKFSRSKVKEAIKIFWEFWGILDEENLTIASTLLIDTSLEYLVDGYDYSTIEIEEYIFPLIEKGIIRLDEKKIVNACENEFISFEIEENEADILYKLFFVIMALGGVYGHLFVVIENKDLILYPHDECGFGVISGIDNNEWVNRYLDLISGISDFVHNPGAHSWGH